MAMRINHLFVSSTDVERSARFYCDFLGFAFSRKFNDGAGDSQTVHKEVQGCDFDLLIVPTGTTKLPLANHIAFEVDSADEFEDLFQKAKAMGLSPRSDVPLESEAGVSTFSMYGRNYRHFYVLDPSWVNVEVMWRKPE
jgi:catechol 2,3-dioxygenase-like lactoylglutathione lyase family enzyme